MVAHRSHDGFSRAVAALCAPSEQPRRWGAQWLDQSCDAISAAPELRFFIDGTRNLGHQAATLNLARRLVELTGFGGLSTFVYADYRRPILGEVTEKIALLMPGVTCQAHDQSIDRWGPFHALRFVSIEQAGALPRCRFGFTGGADDLSVCYARALQVDWFLRLQPFLWDDEATGKSDPFYASSRIEHRRGQQLYLCDEIPNFRRLFIRRAASQNDPPSVLDTQLLSLLQAFRSTTAGVIWPVYGLQHFPSCVEPLMRMLIAAAEIFASRTACRVLIVSFCPMRLPVDARYGCLLHDPESWSGWQRQVGVVQPGPITAPAYRTILASSELPPVIEGQESVGEMLALGRPFLQLRRPERVVGYRYVDIQPDAPFSSWLDALALDLSRAGDAAGAPGDGAAAVVEKLAGLLLRCHSGDEEIRRFFAGLAHQDRLDKLETALAALALLLEQERIGALTIQKE